MTVAVKMPSDFEDEDKSFLRTEMDSYGRPLASSSSSSMQSSTRKLRMHLLTIATMTFLGLCLFKSIGSSQSSLEKANSSSSSPGSASSDSRPLSKPYKSPSFLPSNWWQQKGSEEAAKQAAKAAKEFTYGQTIGGVSSSSSSSGKSQQVFEDSMPIRYNGSFPHVKLNSTLGFQEILAIHLPSRIDKEDELALMGYATDIDVKMFNGVSMNELKDAHLSDLDWKMGPGNIGSWRSHLNAIRHVVTNRLESALIIEDDADWSIDIKEQMQRLQTPLANLIGSMKRDGKQRGPTESHPWGLPDDWDILMLGTCMEMSWADEKSDKEGRTLVDEKLIDPKHLPYLTYEDPTMLEADKISQNPKALLQSYSVPMASSEHSPAFQRRRVVQKANSPVCSLAYAVSRKGAARILYKLTRPHDFAFDNELAWLMEDTYAHGYVVYPPLMKQWRRSGGDNSDIHPQDVSEHPRLGAFDDGDTEDIYKSTRKRLRQLVLHHATRKGKKLVNVI